MSDSPLPCVDDLLAAAARIAPHASVTPVLQSHVLDGLAGAALAFKAEHLQRGGAFKFRGACNAVWSLDPDQAARGVVTHSSGNHGAALALAARTRGIACNVVVPEGAVAAKLANIVRHGATIWRCAPSIQAREAMCAQVQAQTGAALVHPYADPRVIAGQGTAALELLHSHGPLDVLVVPVGGGGLAAGTRLALQALAPKARLVLAEPEGAADTARSLAAGERRIDFTPDTVCDGLRTTLGAPNFTLLLGMPPPWRRCACSGRCSSRWWNRPRRSPWRPSCPTRRGLPGNGSGWCCPAATSTWTHCRGRAHEPARAGGRAGLAVAAVHRAGGLAAGRDRLDRVGG